MCVCTKTMCVYEILNTINVTTESACYINREFTVYLQSLQTCSNNILLHTMVYANHRLQPQIENKQLNKTVVIRSI